MHGTAFHNLYEAHARDVYRFARFLSASDDAAAEITSETFLRAWVGRDRIRVETAKAYLSAIGVDYEEIGQVLGLSVSTVKIRVHRARLKLTAAATEPPGSPP